MNTKEIVRKIFIKLARYKWAVFFGALIGAIAMFLYAKSIPPVYTAKATVFPLTASNENPTSSAISTLLGGGDAPKSFSQDASINIVELAQSRNTREAVVLRRLPGFGNKRIAELLIANYNKTKKPQDPAIKIPADTIDLAAIAGMLLSKSYTAKVLKSGILEVTFSSTDKSILSAVSYELIDKISQFYIDLKIKKAKRDYDFTIQKVDSLQNIIDGFDRRAVRMNNTTLFVPNSKIEYSIPKENLVNAKERVMRLRDASANNREEALWRLQKATPIIATLDKPEPPFDRQGTSSVVYAFIGFIIGSIIIIGTLISPIVIAYIKAEAKNAIFGDDPPIEQTSTSASPVIETTTTTTL